MHIEGKTQSGLNFFIVFLASAPARGLVLGLLDAVRGISWGMVRLGDGVDGVGVGQESGP